MPHHHENKPPREERPAPGPQPEKKGPHLPGLGKLRGLGEEFHTLEEDMKQGLGVIKEDLADIEVRGAETKELIDEIKEDIDRNKDE